MKKGYSFILVLVVMFFLVTLGFSLFSLSYSGYISDKVYSSVTQLRFCARSGAEKAKTLLMIPGSPVAENLTKGFNTYEGTNTIVTTVKFTNVSALAADGSYTVKVVSTAVRAGKSKMVTVTYKVLSPDMANDFYNNVRGNAILYNTDFSGNTTSNITINGSSDIGGAPGIKKMSYSNYPGLKFDPNNPTVGGYFVNCNDASVAACFKKPIDAGYVGKYYLHVYDNPATKNSNFDVFVKKKVSGANKISEISSFISSELYNNASVKMIIVDGDLEFDNDSKSTSLKGGFIFCTGNIAITSNTDLQKFTICAQNINDSANQNLKITHSVNEDNSFLKNTINNFLDFSNSTGNILSIVTTQSWVE